MASLVILNIFGHKHHMALFVQLKKRMWKNIAMLDVKKKKFRKWIWMAKTNW